jgi:thiol-disulfide isomerase/thioredoxin
MKFGIQFNLASVLLLQMLFVLPARASDLTAEQVADQIVSARGKPVLVLLFRSSCPACQAALPLFDKFLKEQPSGRVTVLVFAIDTDKESVENYLRDNRFSFSVDWIKPWQPGELSKAMARAGLQIGTTFGVPLVAALDKNGKNLGQWQGLGSGTLSQLGSLIK